MKIKISQKGFTLLEILLVIALIGILASSVLIAINPTRQLSQSRNAVRRADIETIAKALEQYRVNNRGKDVPGLGIMYKDICPGSGSCIDLGVLVPNYIAGIPRDPSGSSYQVANNANNNGISVKSPSGELGQSIGTNIVVAGSKFNSFDTGIRPGFDAGPTTIAIQSDGKVVLGGQFTTYQGIDAVRLARLNSDGTRDAGVNAGMQGFEGGFVQSVDIQSDSKIVVGGDFTSYQGVSANRIIRLNSDGTRDTGFNMGTAFGTGPTNIVSKISIQPDGKIIAVGLFTDYQGVSANRIIRLNSDGTRDAGFNIGTGFNNLVKTIVLQSDGKVVVGGQFTTYQGVSANRIIRLNSDGTRDAGFTMGTGFDNNVNTVALQSDGKIVVGGQFATYQGVSANRIIRLNSDGSIDSSFNIGTGFGANVNKIVLQSDGKIVVGGQFTTYQGVGANYIIRLNSDGTRDNSFNIGTGFEASVSDIAIQSDGKIVIAGFFTTYQGVLANRIIRLNSDGTRDNSFNIGTGFNFSLNSAVFQSDGKTVAGGSFTTYRGVSANRIIRLNSNGTQDSSFNIGTGFGANVNKIVLQSDGRVVVGGTFTTYQGVSANRIIRLNSDGSIDSSFNIGTGFNNLVNTIVLQSDGKVVVGGTFTTYQGVSANRIIRLNSDGSIDSSFNIGTGFGSGLNSAAIQSDGKVVVGGTFTTYQGVSATGIIRLNSDGTRDAGFTMGTGFNYYVNSVTTIAIQSDGKIVVGGGFTTYQGVSASRIARLNSNGTQDNSFNIGTGFGSSGAWVNDVAIQSDGKIVVGGSFGSYQDQLVGSLISLLP